MRIYVAVQCGVGKEQCEDAVIVGSTIICDGTAELTLLTNGTICVADGVGGHAGGDIASAYVTEQLKLFTVHSSDTNENTIYERLTEINNNLLQKGREIGFPDMATTLTGLVCTENQKYIVHVGNTRLYVLQGQYLKQLTTDHTVYNWLLAMGRVDEAAQCRRNEITNCLGGANSKLAARLSVTPFQDFSVMLLTSDGIHDHVSLDELERLLTSDATELEKCSNMVDAAKNVGSTDDLSAVIIINREEVDAELSVNLG